MLLLPLLRACLSNGTGYPLLIKGYNVLNTSGSTWRAEGFDKAKSPDHCIGCGACAALCPQNIDIPNVMQKLTKALAK